WLARDVFSIRFVSCERDCVGSTITDGLIAFHALYAALRLWRVSASCPHPHSFAWCAACVITANCVWSAFGVVFWLQPGGIRAGWFEPVWRLNAVCQAVLIYSHWNLVHELLHATIIGATSLESSAPESHHASYGIRMPSGHVIGLLTIPL
ncbi:MAG: hypothetical protein SGPRY_013022, partial [Prymnesium sp.]